jgi:hypothetical protein
MDQRCDLGPAPEIGHRLRLGLARQEARGDLPEWDQVKAFEILIQSG